MAPLWCWYSHSSTYRSSQAHSLLPAVVQCLLQMLGEALGVPLSEWPNQLWFQRVYQSQYNSKGAAAAWDKKWEQHKKGERTLELWEAVAQFSIMVRNCLGHEEFANEVVPDVENGLPRLFDWEDVTIVTSWPFAESVGRIPAVVGPIASNLLAVQGSSTGGGGSYSGRSADGTPGGSSQGRGGSSAVSALRTQLRSMPFFRPSLRGMKIQMPPR